MNLEGTGIAKIGNDDGLLQFTSNPCLDNEGTFSDKEAK